MGCLIKDSVMYSSGSARLFDLLDVNISNPSNGELLQYNSTNGKWENSADVWDTMAQNGAHNLLPNSLTTQVINGVTLTVNSDKSITISGSPTTLVAPIVGANFTIPKGQYILSGIDSSVTNMMWNAIVLLNGASVVHTYTISSMDDFSFDTSAYTYTNIQVSMKRIEDNVACSGTIYPMIRLASDPNTDYTPYAPTNHDLAYVRDGWKKNGAYNLACGVFTSKVENGITYIANSDGSVSVSGESTGSNITSTPFTLKAGTYLVGFNPIPLLGGVATDSTNFTILDSSNNHLAGLPLNDATFKVITVAADTVVKIRLYVYANSSGHTTNTKFYPIITTDLNATVADFVPYAKTNRELTNQIHIDSTSITTNTQSGNATPYSYYGSTNIGIKKLIGIWAYETSTAVPVPCGYNPSNGYAFCVSRGLGIGVTVHYAYID